jgi:hypothetical protein
MRKSLSAGEKTIYVAVDCQKSAANGPFFVRPRAPRRAGGFAVFQDGPLLPLTWTDANGKIVGMTADVRQSDATVAREVELRNRVQLSGVGNPKSNMAQGG